MGPRECVAGSSSIFGVQEIKRGGRVSRGCDGSDPESALREAIMGAEAAFLARAKEVLALHPPPVFLFLRFERLYTLSIGRGKLQQQVSVESSTHPHRLTTGPPPLVSRIWVESRRLWFRRINRGKGSGPSPLIGEAGRRVHPGGGPHNRQRNRGREGTPPIQFLFLLIRVCCSNDSYDFSLFIHMSELRTGQECEQSREAWPQKQLQKETARVNIRE